MDAPKPRGGSEPNRWADERSLDDF